MLEKAESKLVTYEARTRGRNLVEVVIFFLSLLIYLGCAGSSLLHVGFL